MAIKGLANATIHINNVNIPIVPNSFTYKEGLGEQKVRTVSGGGGTSETVFTQDAETRMSMAKFTLIPSVDSVEIKRGWQILGNANVITASDDGFSRTFTFMAVVNDAEITIGADTTFEVEFHGETAI